MAAGIDHGTQIEVVAWFCIERKHAAIDRVAAFIRAGVGIRAAIGDVVVLTAPIAGITEIDRTDILVIATVQHIGDTRSVGTDGGDGADIHVVTGDSVFWCVDAPTLWRATVCGADVVIFAAERGAALACAVATSVVERTEVAVVAWGGVVDKRTTACTIAGVIRARVAIVADKCNPFANARIAGIGFCARVTVVADADAVVDGPFLTADDHETRLAGVGWIRGQIVVTTAADVALIRGATQSCVVGMDTDPIATLILGTRVLVVAVGWTSQWNIGCDVRPGVCPNDITRVDSSIAVDALRRRGVIPTGGQEEEERTDAGEVKSLEREVTHRILRELDLLVFSLQNVKPCRLGVKLQRVAGHRLADRSSQSERQLLHCLGVR